MITKEEIAKNPDALVRAGDFLDTILQIQREADKIIEKDTTQIREEAEERYKALEKLFLESGKNNKTLLEKEQEYKTKIESLERDNQTKWDSIEKFMADIKILKDEKLEVEELLKKASFVPATNIPKQSVYIMNLKENFNSILLAFQSELNWLNVQVSENKATIVGFQK